MQSTTTKPTYAELKAALMEIGESVDGVPSIKFPTPASRRLCQLRVSHKRLDGMLQLTDYGKLVYNELLMGEPAPEIWPDIFSVDGVFQAWALANDESEETERAKIVSGLWDDLINHWLPDNNPENDQVAADLGRDWMVRLQKCIERGLFRRIHEESKDALLIWLRLLNQHPQIAASAKAMFHRREPQKFEEVFGLNGGVPYEANTSELGGK